jgi:hypothetical protein
MSSIAAMRLSASAFCARSCASSSLVALRSFVTLDADFSSSVALSVVAPSWSVHALSSSLFFASPPSLSVHDASSLYAVLPVARYCHVK